MWKQRRKGEEMARERLLVIGGGMAATRLVEETVAAAPGRYEICVIGAEPHLAYNRVLLSSVLAGDADLTDIALKPGEWWRDAGVDFLCGRRVVDIDRAARIVTLDEGTRLSYSKLVLATGSNAIRLNIEGAGLPGVHAFRDLADVEALSRLGAEGKNVLVIGGGLLGLEAAYGLVRRGASVMLAHVMDRLMERQLDAEGAAILLRLVEKTGVRVRLGADTLRIGGEGRVRSVEFACGSTLAFDAVVFAVGICANAALANQAGLAVGRGVVVNDGLETSDPDIFAIGECAEHRGLCYGLVQPAYEQAQVLAARLAGRDAHYRGSLVATQLKVSGVGVFSAGDYLAQTHANVLYCKDSRMGVYRKLVVEGDRLTGAILIGDTSGARECLEAIRSGQDVSHLRDQLVFGAPRLDKAA